MNNHILQSSLHVVGVFGVFLFSDDVTKLTYEKKTEQLHYEY